MDYYFIKINRLFMIFMIFAYFFLIHEIKNEDNCIINDSIIRTQILDKLIAFGGDTNINSFNAIEMANKDIFLLCSNTFNYENIDDNYLYIYGLKSSGETYFNENSENYKEIVLSSDDEIQYLNVVGLIINNNQYILICGISDNELCKLIGLENNDIVPKEIKEFFNNDDNYYYLITHYAILNLNQKNKIFLSHLEIALFEWETYNDLSIIYLTKDNNILSIQNVYDYRHYFETEEVQKYEVMCFITEKNYIECLAVYNNNIRVEIYDDSLHFLNEIILDSASGNFMVALSIHLKSEIGVFIYSHKNYQDDTDLSPLYMQIKELYFRDPNYDFRDIIRGEERIFEIAFNADYSDLYTVSHHTISLIRLSENKFSLAYSTNGDCIIIVMFDLYGEHEDCLLIRYYKIDITSYNMNSITGLKLFKFNSFLGIGLSGNLNSEIRGVFSILGYSSKKQITDININLYKENQGFILELSKYFSIENNFFGFELNIKITSISDELSGIRFFAIIENKEKRINDNINLNDKILFDLSAIDFEIGHNYIIEITSIISTPEYNQFTQYSDKRCHYGENADNYENYYKKIIMEEKIFKVNLYISCHEQSKKTCNYGDLTKKIIEIDSIDIIFFSNYIYRRETNNLLNAYLYSIDNYNDDDYCEGENTINKFNFMNECVD